MAKTPAPRTRNCDLSSLDALLGSFSLDAADTWLRKTFGSYDASMRATLRLGTNKNEREYFTDATLMGYVKELPLAPRNSANCPLLVACVHMKHDLTGRDSRVAQFNLAKRILKEAVATPCSGIHGLPAQGLLFFYDGQGHFRLSLVSGEIENRRFLFNSAKRQSFIVHEGGSNPTIRRRFNRRIKTFEDLKEVFSVEALTKAFYTSLFDWYLWATEKDKTITFPNDLSSDDDNRDYLEPAVIRLLTRLMFIWFIKQKGLVPDELFDVAKLNRYIKEFDASSKEQDNYYRVILQNLFFATLNCKPEKRKFKRIYRGMSHERGVQTCYRYVEEMTDKDAFMDLMSKVPFLNCTLFDCLDKKEREQDGGRELYLDGFSDRPDHRAHIHNAFFFDEHQGLIPLFNQYEFTVDENSVTDTDVALDPELLGKVFENLLGSYNPETKETARKATGAFYTPREIVNYMVRESLKSYLRRKCSFADDERLARLFDETDTESIDYFNGNEKKELLDAIYTCKILDPACGSGAFPMGMLHTMVHILDRLDQENLILQGRLLEQYKTDRAIAIPGLTDEEQKERVEMLDKQLKENFSHPDYARKLYLIENCIYGIDIQPIATQISKLRFFISLLCDQLRSSWNLSDDNHGLLSLPNLEAKFVCADSLLSLPKLSGDSLALGTADIRGLKQKLESNRHLVFNARTIETKNKYKARELEIRDEIRDSIRQTLSTPNVELIAKLETQLLDLKKQLNKVAKPKMELRTIQEQPNLFAPSQPVIREVDVNAGPRAKLRASIAKAERIIKAERGKAQQAGSTELDRLANAVSGWDPYDQNACSDFFDASWMFNIKEGFDIVIGNPPYIQLQKNQGSYAKKYEHCGFESYERSGDMYALFVERSNQLVCDGGHVCLIISNKWMLIKSGMRLRHYLQQYRVNQLLNFGDVQFFDNATTYVCILLWSKVEPCDSYLALSTNSKQYSGNFDLTIENELKEKSTGAFTDAHWLIMDAIQTSINRKMEKGATLLKKVLEDAHGKINRGIITGYNDAFYISAQTYNNIIKIDKKASDIIKLMHRGRGIQSYYTDEPQEYLIGTFPSLKIKIEDFPGIKTHLLQFGKKRLEQSGKKYENEDGTKIKARKKTGFSWFETQDSICYWKEFSLPKIIYSNMTTRFPFSFDERGSFSNQRTFILTFPDTDYLLFLTGLFNSLLSKLWMWFHCPELNGGTRELSETYFENFPVPSLQADAQGKVIELTKAIIEKKKQTRECDTSSEEEAIEAILARHYGITEEEKASLNVFSNMLQNIETEDREEGDGDASAEAAPARKPARKPAMPPQTEQEDEYLD